MPIDHKPLHELTEQDLRSLIDDCFREGLKIDYKEALPGNSEGDRKEFLADVSSFANAAGGHLLYGVSEKRDANGQPTGEPELLCGLGDVSPDAEKQRLENMMRDGIEPRIPGIQVRELPLPADSFVLLLHIPRSWAGPHMVSYQDWCRFYSRNSAGKYLLDVGELRAAFVRSELISDRIRRFRTERLARIVAGETPVPLSPQPKVVLHLLPLTMFGAGSQVDIAAVRQDLGLLPPLGGAVAWSRHNFDGFLTFDGPDENGLCCAYAQLFRSGAVEGAGTQFTGVINHRRFIRSTMFERDVIHALGCYLRLQHELGLQPPLLIMLSLMGVKGYSMYVDEFRYFTGRPEQHIIDRDSLAVPEVLLEDLTAEPARILKPCFDAVWNACGYAGSLDYTKDGEWKPR